MFNYSGKFVKLVYLVSSYNLSFPPTFDPSLPIHSIVCSIAYFITHSFSLAREHSFSPLSQISLKSLGSLSPLFNPFPSHFIRARIQKINLCIFMPENTIFFSPSPSLSYISFFSTSGAESNSTQYLYFTT